MNYGEQISQFDAEIRKVIERFRHEYDLPVGGAIGVLEIIKLDLYKQAVEAHSEEGDA